MLTMFMPTGTSDRQKTNKGRMIRRPIIAYIRSVAMTVIEKAVNLCNTGLLLLLPAK